MEQSSNFEWAHTKPYSVFFEEIVSPIPLYYWKAKIKEHEIYPPYVIGWEEQAYSHAYLEVPDPLEEEEEEEEGFDQCNCSDPDCPCGGRKHYSKSYLGIR